MTDQIQQHLDNMEKILRNVHGLKALGDGSQLVGRLVGFGQSRSKSPKAPAFQMQVQTDYGRTSIGVFKEDAPDINTLAGAGVGYVEGQLLTNQFLDIPEAHQPLVVIYRNGNYWNYMAPYTEAMSVPAATLDPKHPMPQIAEQPNPWATPNPGTPAAPQTPSAAAGTTNIMTAPAPTSPAPAQAAPASGAAPSNMTDMGIEDPRPGWG